MVACPKGIKSNRIKPKRLQSKKHLEFVGSHGCCICGKPSGPPHHLLRGPFKRGTGLRAGDNWVIPLCSDHHSALHRHGNEKLFLASYNVYGVDVAAGLANDSPDPKIRFPLSRSAVE